jgi:hypothetical protein
MDAEKLSHASVNSPVPAEPTANALPSLATQLPAVSSPGSDVAENSGSGKRLGEDGSKGAEADAAEPDDEILEVEDDVADEKGNRVARLQRRRRQPRQDAEELRLRGRRELCKTIADIAPQMLKTVKLRVLGRYLDSVRGLEEEDLAEIIRKDAAKLVDRTRVLAAWNTPDPDANRDNLKAIIFAILLQEETYGIEENRLDEKVIEYEKELV